jgi:hypothetical protein
MSERWSRNDDVIATDLDDEVVLLNPATRAVFTLNLTGRALWHRLANSASIDELVATLVSTFAVDEVTAVRDVRAVLEDLAAAGLVQAA